jgi:hypothetical protein
MPWEREVDPAGIYEQRERIAQVLDPRATRRLDFEIPEGIAALSLLCVREPVWAATCLAAGYASVNDLNTSDAVYELAEANPERWGESYVDGYANRYGNLGWEQPVLVLSARVMSQAFSGAVLNRAGTTIPDLQVCFDLHNGDYDAVMECLRGAGTALGGLTG